MNMPIEKHPLAPFLPDGARILMLGSFPPKEDKWSMRFFYPNWINDMWRIVGTIFYGNKHHFEAHSLCGHFLLFKSIIVLKGHFGNRYKTENKTEE
jgi:G:T/U-mismatch repair DNA glycosylase